MVKSKFGIKIITVAAAGLGTFASLRANEYDFGAIGIVRLTRAAVTVFEIGNHYKKTIYNNGLDIKSEEYQKQKSEAHLFGAKKLLDLCCANKGVYIKVGQHIGSLDYLLPSEYVETMKVLYSTAPQSSFNDVLTVLKKDLKKDPYKIFEQIDKNPVGTASLAQVYKATLKNGEQVAIKVQHRSVKNNSYVDIKTMSVLVKIISWVFPEFKFDWLVEESKKNIPQELDFTKEGENAEKVKKLFKEFTWLHVPKIYWNLSSNRVLTMEFIEGGQVNDLKYYKDNKISPYEVTNKLGKLYSNMIFLTGFVHSDPHPGNIIIRKKEKHETEIVLLDHGLYATLTDKFRCNYTKLWMAILKADETAMQKYCENLGVKDMYSLLVCMVSGRSWDTIKNGVQRKKNSSKEYEHFHQEVQSLLPKITEILQQVDNKMLLVLKTNDLIRSIEYNLNTHTRMTAFLEMSKCCVKSVYREKLKTATSKWSQWSIKLQEKWSILKISLYYLYLGIISFDFN